MKKKFLGLSVLICSGKGGVGKSTTCINLAVGLVKKGFKVIIVDADPQNSISRWNSDREQSSFEDDSLVDILCISKQGLIGKTISQLKETYDFLLIDTAGRNSKEMLSAMPLCDCVIAPVQFSQFDLDTLVELQDQFESSLELSNKNFQALVYPTMISSNTKRKANELKELKEFIEGFEHLKLMECYSQYRVIYRDISSSGLSVLDLHMNNSYKDVKEEVCKFIDEFLDFMKLS